MKRALESLLERATAKMTPEAAARRLARLAAIYGRRTTPEAALRMLMILDERLYALQGSAAVAWEGGVHPKHRLTRYHDFFVQRLAPGQAVLDIGCGMGALAHSMAARAGARVTGIDLSEANIRKARERFAHPSVEYIHGDALKDLPGKRFDVVVMSNVLEHIERRVEFIRRVNAAVQPARWLVRVPVFERDWRVPLKRELGLEWRLDPTHFTEYTLESFREEMAQAAMRIEHLEIRWSEIWSELCPAAP
jgi:SAM-dependent methyltransferase